MPDPQSPHTFITGGANGIGLAIARSLAARGASITLADIDSAALHTASAGTEWCTIPLDVRDREGWARARATAEARFGPVDVLVNNAGIGPDGNTLADTDFAAFDRIVALDLTSVFNGIATFAAAMRERGRGHIVNNASLAGLVGFPKVGAYCAVKAGVVAMSEALRDELAPFGVRVSVLCPGPVATRLRETTLAAGSQASPELLGETPRGSDPAEIGEIVAEAVAANRFYILPHDGLRHRVEARHAEIAQAW